ncbi:MAG: peptidylprolyl isomerase [Halobacteriovoraceae bacterium]|nr:peptidylprolyl isomerase [Halobacteriovoraceae bacterium]|tara:strand:- start:198281 stop:198817 length:537 start_codon:yes stop_codon:yes gene_type:complete
METRPKAFNLIVLITIAVVFSSSCFKEGKKTSSTANKELVRLKTVHGDLLIKLFKEKAPITTSRFKSLVKDGFYNGLKFHRVIPNFVVQGGDPTGTGTGGSGMKLKAELNSIPHEKGTVAMARGTDINSADSQFYIALKTLPHLDGKYTVFGKVVKGIKILDSIRKGDKMLSVSLESN